MANSSLKNMLIISYDEYKNNFVEKDITDNSDFVEHINSHKYVVLCTQKSTSSTTSSQLGASPLHFQHVFKNIFDKTYVQIAKYDSATLLSAEVTDNYSLRTRIFVKKDSGINNKITNIVFDEIKDGSFREYFKSTANKSALLCRFKINDQVYNIINTDLYSLKVSNRPLYNDGLLYRQQEFLAIIKDFKLYEKYAKGENIILAGSLKFNIYPLKMTNILTIDNMTKINKHLLSISSKNKDSLKKYNELSQYLNKLIINYSTNQNNNNYSNNMHSTNPNNQNTQNNNEYFNNQNNEKSIKIIINKYKIEHKQIKNLLEKFKENLQMNITGNSHHEHINTGLVGSVPKSLIRGTQYLSQIITSKQKAPSAPNSAIKIENPTRSPRTISARNRILYALQNKNKDKIIYSTFKIGEKMVNNRFKNKERNTTRFFSSLQKKGENDVVCLSIPISNLFVVNSSNATNIEY